MTLRRRAIFATAAVLALGGAWQVASAAWIHGKGYLAQQLIAHAWSDAREGELARRPWPGADLRPVARLSVPSRHLALYVLDNASPRALAFGPALVGGTATLGSSGNAVVVGHRDTHFRFLQRLQPDDQIDIEGAGGARSRYRVREAIVIEQHEVRVLESTGNSQLTLITCWPFDAVLPGTPWRYVVIADRIV